MGRSIDNNRRINIILTTNTGTEIPHDSDMTAMQVLRTSESLGATLDFYLSWDKQLDIELVNVRVTASESVGLTYNMYYWALNAWKSISPYDTELTGAQALASMSTAYPITEDIPSGTKIKLSVVTAGPCTVGVQANGRI